jgi:hypothetical protein
MIPSSPEFVRSTRHALFTGTAIEPYGFDAAGTGHRAPRGVE